MNHSMFIINQVVIITVVIPALGFHGQTDYLVKQSWKLWMNDHIWLQSNSRKNPVVTGFPLFHEMIRVSYLRNDMKGALCHAENSLWHMYAIYTNKIFYNISCERTKYISNRSLIRSDWFNDDMYAFTQTFLLYLMNVWYSFGSGVNKSSKHPNNFCHLLRSRKCC